MSRLVLFLFVLAAFLALSASACSQTYTVVSGDTCYAIAAANGLSVDQLEALNPGINCNDLQIGQVICISGSGPAPPGPPPPSGSPSYDQFVQALTTNGYPTPTQDQYNAFTAGYSSAGQISTTRELAMFLSEIMWESGGLIYKEEINCTQTQCPNEYRSPGDPPNEFYYGRGYIQLSWSYNYKAASQYLLNDESILFLNPSQVATDETLSWNTAFWFWAVNVHPDPGVQAGQFGSATNKINGGLECNPCRGACTNRFQIYGNVLKAFGDDEPPNNAGC